jgi:hypothetical protein
VKRLRLVQDCIILADGTVAKGATICRKFDSIEMIDGSEIPSSIVAAVEHVPDAMAAPSRARHVLAVPQKRAK